MCKPHMIILLHFLCGFTGLRIRIYLAISRRAEIDYGNGDWVFEFTNHLATLKKGSLE